jgi:hypothetical protein
MNQSINQSINQSTTLKKHNNNNNEIEETLSRTVPFRDCDVAIPKKGGGSKKKHTTGFRKYTELCNNYRDSHPFRYDCESAIESIIKPLLTEGRNIYRYKKD